VMGWDEVGESRWKMFEGIAQEFALMAWEITW
jgi:hypothetical protein